MTKEIEEFNPEKKLLEVSGKFIKRFFLLIIALLGYWELYQFVSEKPNLDVELKSSIYKDKRYISTIEIKNGSESFSKEDIVSPIEIIFTDKIFKIVDSNSAITSDQQIKNNVTYINFDLLNKNEKYEFEIISLKRPQILDIKYRIQGIEKINFYDFETKPSPIWRVFNIWFIFLIFAIITFGDALLVILKDGGLSKLTTFVNDFPLNSKNREEFIKNYKQLYSNYKLRLKPSTKFMGDFTVRNLVYMFPEYKENDVEFVKFMINLKTELYILYRIRTVFIMVSPIIFIISLFGMAFNYLFYEFDIVYKYLNLALINKMLATCLLLLLLYIIFNPRKTMNRLSHTKDANLKY